MRIIQALPSIPTQDAPCALAMGYFDGLHLGHQAVIEAAKLAAQAQGLRLALFTFLLDEPAALKGSSILSQEEKHTQLAALGVNTCYEPPFAAIKGMAPQDFFHQVLLARFGAKALFCGQDFCFGTNRAGNVAMLQQLCAANGLGCHVVPTALYKGQPISSSRIRAALQNGDIPDVNAMLGRPYAIQLPVQHGKKLGSTLGFPTINQVFPDQQQPPAQGVYITRAVVDGHAWPAVTGYGTRPTVGGQSPTCETFIPGFEGDLYDSVVRVQFYRQIDKTRRFDSVEALAAAVRGWAAQALAYFEGEQ